MGSYYSETFLFLLMLIPTIHTLVHVKLLVSMYSFEARDCKYFLLFVMILFLFKGYYL